MGPEDKWNGVNQENEGEKEEGGNSISGDPSSISLTFEPTPPPSRVSHTYTRERA